MYLLYTMEYSTLIGGKKMNIKNLDEELENLKNTNPRIGKKLLLTVPIPLYIEVIKICKRDNYVNVQEFIREAIRDKVSKESKEGILNESKEPKEGILNG